MEIDTREVIHTQVLHEDFTTDSSDHIKGYMKKLGIRQELLFHFIAIFYIHHISVRVTAHPEESRLYPEIKNALQLIQSKLG